MDTPGSRGPRNRTYFAGDLRQDLIRVAVELAAEVGPAGLSLREVARRVGVSHAAPKNHFADKRALFTAIAVEAHHRLADYLRAAPLSAAGSDDGGPRSAPPDQDPGDALLATGEAYLRFAREQPGWYAVMWEEDLQDREDPALVAASQASFGVLVDRLGATVSGRTSGPDPVDLAALAWALVHGLASLTAAGALRDLPGGHDVEQQQAHLLGQLRLLAPGGDRPTL